jgi:hypothetical protein
MISAIGSIQQSLTSLLNINAVAATENGPASATAPDSGQPTATHPASGSAGPSTLFSSQVLEQLLQYQSNNGTGAASEAAVTGQSGSAQTPADAAVQALMNVGAKEAATGKVDLSDPYQSTLFQIASGGSGSLTQGQLEKSVIAGGGTAQEADALYAQLDPSGTGTVTETQMAGQLATPATGPDTFGNALSLYLNGGQSTDALESDLLQKLMNIGLNNSQASTVAQQLNATVS